MKNEKIRKNQVLKISKSYLLATKIVQHKNILRYFDKFIFSHKEIDNKDNILILGSPRSGTTWLMEILMNLPNYAPIYEPINPIWYPNSFKIGFTSRSYVPKDNEWVHGEKYLKQIFCGEQASQLPLYRPNLRVIMSRLLANKFIIKSIRLSRMFIWITNKFQFRCVLYIVRNPCAVVASQLNSGFCGYHEETKPYRNLFPSKQKIIKDASKIDFLTDEILKKLKKINSLEEILAATWCIDNFAVLSTPKPHPLKIISYEKMIKDGEQSIKDIFNEMGVTKVPAHSLKNIRKPSMVSMVDEYNNIKCPDRQISKWKKSLSKKQIENILSVVSDFDLDIHKLNLESGYNEP